MRNRFKQRNVSVANQYRDELIERYGKSRGSRVQHALAFELCEYGYQASKEELKKLFP